MELSISNINEKSIPALAAGNTVVLKPSSETPITGGLKIAELFDEADLPQGVANVVQGPGKEVGDELLTNEATDYISFTGSTEIGRQIAETAGRALTEVSLELGREDLLIVFSDFDIEQAVNIAKFGGLFHVGQNCMSIERVIIEESIAEPFIKQLVEEVKDLTVGDPGTRTPTLVL